MPAEICAACHQQMGSSPDCPSCRDAAVHALARHATEVTPGGVKAVVKQVERYIERRPWWARAAPAELIGRLRLLAMLLGDVVRRRYWLRWQEVANLSAAALYVLSPADLISDFLGPIGFADDLLVLEFTWRTMRQQLADYCAAKGLDPGRFGVKVLH